MTINVGAATRLVITGPSAVIAGDAHAYTVTAEDVSGNTVTGYVGTVTITSSDVQAVLPPPSLLTLGVGTFSVTLKTAGSKNVGANDGTLTATPLPVGVNPAGTQLVITGPGTATAGVGQDFTVTAEDAFNNVDTTFAGTVTIISSDGAMVSSPPSGTLPSGVRVFHVTLKTAGSQNVGATTGAISATALPVTVSPAAASALVITGPGTATAGVVTDYTVTARDPFGNTATGYGGTVTVTSSDSQATLPAPSTLSSGVGIFHVTFKTAGSRNVGAHDGSLTAAALPVTVTPSGTIPSTFKPLIPARLLDTRVSNGLGGRFTAGVPRTFQVARRGGVPGNATAVTGNLTVTDQTMGWAVFLGPNATATPSTSTINFSAGQVIANGVTVALGSGGTLSATYLSMPGQTTNLVFDVTGYFVPEGTDATAATYAPLTPARLLDTRVGNGLSGRFTAGVPRTFQVTGRGGVPGNATAVTGNLTITDQTFAWAVFLGPNATATPSTSTINFSAGQVIANGVTVALGSGGTLSATYLSTPDQTTNLVFDVTGYFSPDPGGAKFIPLTPARLLDTRVDNGLSGRFISLRAQDAAGNRTRCRPDECHRRHRQPDRDRSDLRVGRLPGPQRHVDAEYLNAQLHGGHSHRQQRHRGPWTGRHSQRHVPVHPGPDDRPGLRRDRLLRAIALVGDTAGFGLRLRFTVGPWFASRRPILRILKEGLGWL